MFRILITGCRNWKCFDVAEWVVGSLREKYGTDITIVHGMAPGVDATFAHVCGRHGIADEPHPADWKAHSKGAGPRRNQEMVDAGARFAIAVHRDLAGSKGTGDCVRRCLAAGIPVYHVDGLHSTRRIRDASFLSPPRPDPPARTRGVKRGCPICGTPGRLGSGPRFLSCPGCGIEFFRDAAMD